MALSRKQVHKRYVNKRREELWDSYVRSLIQKHHPEIFVTPEMIVAKRENLIAIREAKKSGVKPPAKIQFFKRATRKDKGKISVTRIVCKTCKIEKDRSAFGMYRRKDGSMSHYYECKGCKQSRADARKERFEAIKYKVCSRCKIEKPVSEYKIVKRSSGKRGNPFAYFFICRKCHSAEQTKRYTNATPEDMARYSKNAKRWRQKNPDKVKVTRDRNNRKRVDTIDDNYVVDTLKISKTGKDLSRRELRQNRNMIELKRLQIQLQRAIKNKEA